MQPNKAKLPDHFQPRLGKCFADEMRQYPWSANLEPHYSRLRATGKTITEITEGKPLFSNALWDICFKDMSEAVLWHYTTISGLTGILKSREIWLHSLTKRMSQGEVTDFAQQFDYRGLLDIGADGQQIAHKFARDLFYLSLTEQEEPGALWEEFGEVRLRLKIAPVQQRAQLRRMEYLAGSNPLTILKRFAQKRFDRTFLPWQVSQKSAFFLDSHLSSESEVRLLVKRFEETTDLVIKQSNGHEAVAIPISKNNARVSIELVCVEVKTNEILSAAQQLLCTHVPDLNIRCNVCPL